MDYCLDCGASVPDNESCGCYVGSMPDSAQAAAPAAKAKWAYVPIEPTQAMLDAVVTSMDDFLLGKEAEKQYREDWAAMIAAAPSHPASI